MGVTQHSYSSSVDGCNCNPVLFSWFESRDVQVVLATIHCPVLVLLLLRLHTPHLEKSRLQSIRYLYQILNWSNLLLKDNIFSIWFILWGVLFSYIRAFFIYYLVTLYDTIVGVMRRRLPAQDDGVILFMTHCYWHCQWRGTGHWVKRVTFRVTHLFYSALVFEKKVKERTQRFLPPVSGTLRCRVLLSLPYKSLPNGRTLNSYL